MIFSLLYAHTSYFVNHVLIFIFYLVVYLFLVLHKSKVLASSQKKNTKTKQKRKIHDCDFLRCQLVRMPHFFLLYLYKERDRVSIWTRKMLKYFPCIASFNTPWERDLRDVYCIYSLPFMRETECLKEKEKKNV